MHALLTGAVLVSTVWSSTIVIANALNRRNISAFNLMWFSVSVVGTAYMFGLFK